MGRSAFYVKQKQNCKYDSDKYRPSKDKGIPLVFTTAGGSNVLVYVSSPKSTAPVITWHCHDVETRSMYFRVKLKELITTSRKAPV